VAYDASATRTRLLDAAFVEFAGRGLAGARIDRIASEAGANKQAIYLYFGSKAALFDAVLESRLGTLADLVPFTANNFSAYVGALFDHLVAHPDLVRLTQWKALERDQDNQLEIDSHTNKAQELADALGVRKSVAMDYFMLSLGMAQSWLTTSAVIRSAGAEQAERLQEHRAALVATVEAMTRQ
jgi:AcrR family transcriptional regulator